MNYFTASAQVCIISTITADWKHGEYLFQKVLTILTQNEYHHTIYIYIKQLYNKNNDHYAGRTIKVSSLFQLQALSVRYNNILQRLYINCQT